MKIVQFLYILFIFSCSTILKNKDHDSALIAVVGFDLNTKEKNEKEKIQQDLDMLVYMLEHGYGGRKYQSEAEYKNTIKLLKQLNIKEMNSYEFCNMIEEKLIQIKDMHLSAMINGNYCSSLRRMTFIKGSFGKII